MKKISIVKNYFIAFILIIVLPIFIMIYFLYYSYSNTLIENFSNKSTELLDTICNEIEREIKENSLILARLISEKIYISNESIELNELISRWNKTSDINFRYNLSKIIDNKLEDIFSYVNGIESVVFYLKDTGFYFYGSYPKQDEILVRNSHFYKKALDKKGEVLVLDLIDVSSKNDSNMISLAISLDNYVFNGDVETAFICINTDVFTSIYKKNSIEIVGETIILDDSNKVLFSTNSELINLPYNEMLESKNKILYNKDFFSENINGEKKLIATRIIPKTNWKIVKVVDYKDLMGNTTSINNSITFMIIIILLLFVIFSSYFLKSIIIPIQNLIIEMRKVRQGNLDVEVEVSKQGEIAELSTTFNNMIKDVKKLLITNKEKEIEKVEAEMDALQAQINPHFIANTLTSIRFMAMIAKVNNIRDMTEAFIKIISSTFNRNSKFTTIEKEIDTLKSYVYIMKVRHGNKYDVVFEIDEEIKKNYILKMLIQPILENAILHGVSTLEGIGLIKIKGKKENSNISLEIIDNGQGMNKEQIERLLYEDCRNDRGFTSIGVKNVNRRIKLNHGEVYGIYIESILREYTKVKVVVPIIKEEGEVINNV